MCVLVTRHFVGDYRKFVTTPRRRNKILPVYHDLLLSLILFGKSEHRKELESPAVLHFA